MSKKAFTLIEILVSTLILALIMIGLSNLFVTGRRYIQHSRARMTAAEAGRFFLSPLQMQISQNIWNTTCLQAGNCSNEVIGTAQGLDRDYTIKYAINNNFPLPNLHRVVANISWYEN